MQARSWNCCDSSGSTNAPSKPKPSRARLLILSQLIECSLCWRQGGGRPCYRLRNCAGRGCGATARHAHGRKSGESARTPAIVLPSERQLEIEAMLPYRDRYVRHGARQHRAEGPGAEYVARISIDRTRRQVEDKLVKGHGGDGQGQDRRAGSSGTSLAGLDIQAGIAAGAIKSRLLCRRVRCTASS